MTDLSQREPSPKSPIPSFLRPRHQPSSIAATAAGLNQFFRPNGAVTVLFITMQVSAAGTVQLLCDGLGVSPVLNVTVNSIIRFAGLVMPNNSVLSFAVSTGMTIQYDVVWVKDFHTGLIEKQTTVSFGSSSGSGAATQVQIQDPTNTANDAAVLNDAPPETGAGALGLVVRAIGRRKGQTLSITPLLAAGVFTSAWFDSELSGTCFVTAKSVSNVANAATTGLQIQQSDDQINIDNIGAVGSQTTSKIAGVVRLRYWRIVYTNGGTNQASFTLTVTESPIPISSDSLASANPAETTSIAASTLGAGAAATSFADGISNQSGSLILNSAANGGTQRVAGHLFNGSTWDRPRNNATGTTGDTGAKVASFNGATQTNFDAPGAVITILLGTVSGTNPTLSAQLQFSPDGGTTWVNYGPALANLTASNQQGIIVITPRQLQTPAGVFSRQVNVAAAGADGILTVPAGGKWRVQNARVLLVTSATVASRTVRVVLDDGGGGNLVVISPRLTQAASLTGNYYFGQGFTQPAAGAASGTDGENLCGFPRAVLPVGYRIKTAVINIQVGDAVTLVANVEQVPDTDFFSTGANATAVIPAPLPRTWRVNYTIAGTTPSFTINSVQVNYTR
jgi:hypothetical protein